MEIDLMNMTTNAAVGALAVGREKNKKTTKEKSDKSEVNDRRT
jgi:hypothetical protein